MLRHPFFETERVRLHQGDALDVLADLETASVDAVVTDPPYSSGGMMRTDRSRPPVNKYVGSEHTKFDELINFSGDNRDQRSFLYWCALWLGECLRITKPGGVCMLFTDWRQLPTTTDALQLGGWIWRGVVPWHKTSTVRPAPGRFQAQCEYVVWGSSGAMEFDPHASCLPGFYQAPTPGKDREHFTQKSLAVMREMMAITPENGIVLDPFMGSGTTGAAAVIEGRRFVGAEMVEHYCQVAEQRIRTALQESTGREAQESLEFA